MDKTTEEISEAWYEFINDEYFKFRGNTRKSISEFADWFDLPQGQMSAYMKHGGRIPKGANVISKFVKRLGPAVYEILGLPEPDDSIYSLPPKLRSAALEIKEALASYDVSGDSDEAERIATEILIKHGYKIKKPEDSSS